MDLSAPSDGDHLTVTMAAPVISVPASADLSRLGSTRIMRTRGLLT